MRLILKLALQKKRAVVARLNILHSRDVGNVMKVSENLMRLSSGNVRNFLLFEPQCKQMALRAECI